MIYRLDLNNLIVYTFTFSIYDCKRNEIEVFVIYQKFLDLCLSLFLRITVSASKAEFKVRLKVEQILIMIVKSKNLEILQFFLL